MTVNDFDHNVTLAVQGWPSWWQPVMVFASFLADPVTIALVAVGLLAAAHRAGQPRLAWAFGWTLPAMLLNGIAKELLRRPRPETLYVAKMPLHTYSFPSGHAFCATVVYGLLAYVAAKYLPSPWGYGMAAVLVGLIGLIGVSRVYLGAHFPTDVLGGWLFGFMVLVAIILALKI